VRFITVSTANKSFQMTRDPRQHPFWVVRKAEQTSGVHRFCAFPTRDSLQCTPSVHLPPLQCISHSLQCTPSVHFPLAAVHPFCAFPTPSVHRFSAFPTRCSAFSTRCSAFRCAKQYANPSHPPIPRGALILAPVYLATISIPRGIIQWLAQVCTSMNYCHLS